MGDSSTWIIGVIPPRSTGVRSIGDPSAAGHFEVAVGVGCPHPMPGIAQPIGAILLILVSKPRDLVVAPHPIELAAVGPGLSGLFTHTVVVELDEIRQVVARPAARGDPALAPVVNAVGKS